MCDPGSEPQDLTCQVSCHGQLMPVASSPAWSLFKWHHFPSTGTAVARREFCVSKGEEEFKVKAQLFNLQLGAAWSGGNFGGGLL